MNAQEFVNAIKLVAGQGAAIAVLQAFKKPPGRKPEPTLAKLSEWFNRLSAEDKASLETALEYATNHAAYSVLAVLDGLMAVEPTGPKGKLLLFYQKDQRRALINDPDSEELTVLFKQISAEQ